MPSGSLKYLKERLTRSEDGKSLSYHFELTGPQYVTLPIVGDSTWIYEPDVEFIVDDCNPVNSRVCF